MTIDGTMCFIASFSGDGTQNHGENCMEIDILFPTREKELFFCDILIFQALFWKCVQYLKTFVQHGIQPDMHRDDLGSGVPAERSSFLRGLLHALLAAGLTNG